MTNEAEQQATPQTPPLTNEALFLSGSLVLDLVNTELMIRWKKHDVLASPEALAAWWQEACKRHCESQSIIGEEPIVWNVELLTAVKALRASLRHVANQVIHTGAVDEEALEPLNAILALGYPCMQQTEQGTMRQVMRLRDATRGSLVLPITLSALHLFTEADWQRLHSCKNDRCILYFYDATKSGTRQWCSLSCMNRSRSLRHYKEKKKTSSSVIPSSKGRSIPTPLP